MRRLGDFTSDATASFLNASMASKRNSNFKINSHLVSSVESDEFSLLQWATTHSSTVGLDAEWKPAWAPISPPSFPPVSILQLAFRLTSQFGSDTDKCTNDTLVFLLDLQSIPLPSIWEMLRDMLVSPDILKLGFRFKQDLTFLSATFRSHGCDAGLEMVEPFLDITNIYYHLKNRHVGKKLPKETKSLAAICEEVLGVSISKELQCSDWSCRPLTEEQVAYAAADAYCLLEIFAIFQQKFLSEGNSAQVIPGASVGLREILEKSDGSDNILRLRFCEASKMVKSAVGENYPSIHSMAMPNSCSSWRNAQPLDDTLLKIIRKYGERMLLEESDRKPRTSKRKGKRQALLGLDCKKEGSHDWQGPAPWDLSVGGDGFPKFLCDVMVEGLAKHLRCVGFDAAVPSSKKPEPRQLIEQAHKEKRVLLTRDAKLLKYRYIISNQVYRVKSLLKNEQLLEVIEVFQLKICEDQLMSRCTRCNGRFIQKPLTTEEAIAAAKGFQVIPQCLYDRNFEFWQCTDCNQLYWEGTQYHNAVQKFINVCKLNE